MNSECTSIVYSYIECQLLNSATKILATPFIVNFQTLMISVKHNYFYTRCTVLVLKVEYLCISIVLLNKLSATFFYCFTKAMLYVICKNFHPLVFEQYFFSG